MAFGWKSQRNKDYHFLVEQDSTTQNYGFQFVVSCTAQISLYTILKSISQNNGSYLSSGVANISLTYKALACVGIDLHSFNIGFSLYSKDQTTSSASATAVNVPITISGDKAKVTKILVQAVEARLGGAIINTHAVQATV